MKGCIDNKQWEAYSLGSLSAAEWKQMQEHIASCEICADIQEGIDAMADSKKLGPKITRIHQQVDQILAPQKGRILPLYIKWSAAAALLIVSGLILFQIDKQMHGDEQLAYIKSEVDSSQNKNLSEPIPAPFQTKSKENPTNGPTQNRINRIKPIEKKDRDASENKNQVFESQTAADEIKKEDIVTEKKVIQEDKALMETTMQSEVEKNTAPVVVQELEKKEMSSFKSRKKSLSFPSNVSNTENNLLFNTRNVVSTIQVPIQDSLLYQKALNQYNQGQYDSSLVNLQILLRDSGSQYFELSKNLQTKIIGVLNRNLQKDSSYKK